MQPDASEVPELMTARNWVDETGWQCSQYYAPSLKNHEGKTPEHEGFWVCLGLWLSAKEL